MLRKSVQRLKEWSGVVALFMVLAGGTAYAANTIGSSDVIDESLLGQDIKNNTLTGADVLESSLKLGATWRVVGSAGQPAFGRHEDCQWQNYDSVHSSAAFTRDVAGFVHLKGTVKALDLHINLDCGQGSALEPVVFVLPPGYRPQKREATPTIGGRDGFSVHIDGPQLQGAPAGSVSIDGPIGSLEWVSIDNISFRCAPSGANGCP